MNGFDQKVLHLKHESDQDMEITVEVDFAGSLEWTIYQVLKVPAGGYVHYEFPQAYQTPWVRLVPSRSGVVTGIFFYS